MKISTRSITCAAMLSAIAYLLMMVSKIIPQVSGFLQFDVKDVIIVIGSFVMGPVYALIVTAVVTFLEFLTASHTGVIGLLMNFVSTGAFCVTAGLVYLKRKTLPGAVAGLILGTLVLTVVMLLWNYYITPIYMKIPREAVAAMLPTVFLPFNLVKGFINSGLTLLVYKPVVGGLRRCGLIEKKTQAEPTKKMSPALVIGIILLLLFVPALISMM